MERFTDEYIEMEAKKMGLSAEVKAGGGIFVSSPFGGHWIINPCGNGFRLQHENTHIGGSCRRGTYHKHDRVFKNQFAALRYISSHDSHKPFCDPRPVLTA